MDFWFNCTSHRASQWDVTGQNVGPGSNPKWLIDNNYLSPCKFETLLYPPFETFSTSAGSPSGWNQLTLTRNGSEFVFYFNGMAVGSGTATGNFPSPSPALQFGGSAFPGLLDDVVICDRVLSSSEIQDLAGINVPEPLSLALFLTGVAGSPFAGRRRTGSRTLA